MEMFGGVFAVALVVVIELLVAGLMVVAVMRSRGPARLLLAFGLVLMLASRVAVYAYPLLVLPGASIASVAMITGWIGLVGLLLTLAGIIVGRPGASSAPPPQYPPASHGAPPYGPPR